MSKKKILCQLMAFVMVFTMIPLPAFAETGKTYYCGKTEHTHTDVCYTECNEKDLDESTSPPEYVLHEHTANCMPTCGIETHIHDAACEQAATNPTEPTIPDTDAARVEALKLQISELPDAKTIASMTQEERTALYDKRDALYEELNVLFDLDLLTDAEIAEMATKLTEVLSALDAAAVPVLAAPIHANHSICGHRNGCDHTDCTPDGGWEAISNEEELRDAAATGGSYYLTADILLETMDEEDDAVGIEVEKTMNLCLNDYKIGERESWSYFTIKILASGKLTLCDCATEDGSIGTTRYYKWVEDGPDSAFEPSDSSDYIGTTKGGLIDNIAISVDGTFEMYGGTIGRNGVTVASDGIFDLYGGKVLYSRGAGVENAGDFTMYGGEISYQEDGGVRNTGTFVMHGGEISYCEDGGVYNRYDKDNSKGDPIFEMHGGKISHNSDSGVKGSDFIMYDGEISYNTARGYGGGVDSGSFTMYGGSISHNQVVTLSPDYESTVEHTCGGGVSSHGLFNFYGGKITDNYMDTVDHPNNLCCEKINIPQKVSDGSAIGIYCQPETKGDFCFAEGAAAAESKAVFSSDRGYEIKVEGDTLVMKCAPTHIHGICGKAGCTHTDCEKAYTILDGGVVDDYRDIEYDQNNEASYCLGGHSYGTLVIPAGKTLNLCLNGWTMQEGYHTISDGINDIATTECTIDIEEGGVLNLCDCSGANGTPKGAVEALDKRLTGIRNNGELNLYGVNIKGEQDVDIQLGSGKAIHLPEALPADSSICVSITDVPIDGAPVPFATGDGAAASAAYFLSKEGYHIVQDGSELKMKLTAELVDLQHNGHNICGDASCDHGDGCKTTWTGILTEAELKNAAENDGSIYLGKDIVLTEVVQVKGKLNLCLNDHVLSAKSAVFEILDGGELNLCDCMSETGTTRYWDWDDGYFWEGRPFEDADPTVGGVINGRDSEVWNEETEKYEEIGAIEVNENATFNMYGGALMGDCLVVNSGKFTVYNGEIYGGITNTSSVIMYNGKLNSRVHGGEFTMYGGEIFGVRNAVKVSKFIMHGGKLHHNYLDNGGAAVDGGIFEMHGGEICENEDGMAVEVREFYMYGGKIHSNEEIGVITLRGAIYGGEISGNPGGGLLCMSEVGGRFTMYGGKITGNGRFGVKFYNDEGAEKEVTLYGGDITGNLGGNLCILGKSNLPIYLPEKMEKDASFGITLYNSLNEDELIPTEDAPVVFAEGANAANNLEHFFSDQAFTIQPMDESNPTENKLAMCLHTHNVCGETNCSHGGHPAVSYVGVGTDAELKEAVKDGKNVVLQNDILLNDGIAVAKGETLNLCLNGYMLTQGKARHNVFDIEEGGVLNLCDCKGENGAVRHWEKDSAGNWQLLESGTGEYSTRGGVITGYHEYSDSYRSYAVESYGTFNLYGGNIAGNKGAAVYAAGEKGIFNLYGGAVCCNTLDVLLTYGDKEKLVVEEDALRRMTINLANDPKETSSEWKDGSIVAKILWDTADKDLLDHFRLNGTLGEKGFCLVLSEDGMVRLADGFFVTVNTTVSGSPSDSMMQNGYHLYLKDSNGNFTKLNKYDDAQYAFAMPIGRYALYYGTEKQKDAQLILENIEVKDAPCVLDANWFAVTYDGNGGDIAGGSTKEEYVLENLPVTVTDTLPIHVGKAFTGWLYDGHTYRAGDKLLDKLTQNIELEAQWGEMTGAYIEVKLQHKSAQDTGFDQADGKADVTVQLMGRAGGSKDAYQPVGEPIVLKGQTSGNVSYAFDSTELISTYSGQAYDGTLDPTMEYKLEVKKEGYEPVKDQNLVSQDANGIWTLKETLEYVPSSFNMKVNVALGEDLKDTQKPTAANVKYLFYNNGTGAWEYITQHSSPAAYVDANLKNGADTVEYPVWRYISGTTTSYGNRAAVTGIVVNDQVLEFDVRDLQKGTFTSTAHGYQVDVAVTDSSEKWGDLTGVHYDAAKGQVGNITATVSGKNAKTVTLDFGGDGATLDGKTSPVVINVLRQEELNDYIPVREDGKIFGGWYTDEACTEEADTYEKISNGGAIHAKWTDAKTVTLNLSVGGYYREGSNEIPINPLDRAKNVDVLVQRAGAGGAWATVPGLSKTVEISGWSADGRKAVVSGITLSVPDDSQSYRIVVKKTNYQMYSDENFSDRVSSYTANGTVDAYVCFEPTIYAQSVTLDVSGIGKGYRPAEGIVRIEYKDSDGNYTSIVQHNTDEKKGLNAKVEGDIAKAGTENIWTHHFDGNLYQYGGALYSLTWEENGTAEEYSGNDERFSVNVTTGVHAKTTVAGGYQEDRAIKVELAPNSYDITFNGIDGITNSADFKDKVHTWSHETKLADFGAPKKDGEVFVCWSSESPITTFISRLFRSSQNVVSAIPAEVTSEVSLTALWHDLDDEPIEKVGDKTFILVDEDADGKDFEMKEVEPEPGNTGRYVGNNGTPDNPDDDIIYIPVDIYGDDDKNPDCYIPQDALEEKPANSGLYVPKGKTEPVYVAEKGEDGSITQFTEVKDNGDGTYTDDNGTPNDPSDDIIYIPDQDGDGKPEKDTNGDGIYEGTDPKKDKEYIIDRNKEPIYVPVKPGENGTYKADDGDIYIPVDRNNDNKPDENVCVNPTPNSSGEYTDKNSNRYAPVDTNSDGIPEVFKPVSGSGGSGGGSGSGGSGGGSGSGGSSSGGSGGGSGSGGSGSGGSGAPAANVIVGKTENGKVTVGTTHAEKDTIVTITVAPDPGYEVGTIKVTDSDGKEVKVTEKGDGKYTFIKPDKKVTIAVTFVKIAEMEEITLENVDRAKAIILTIDKKEAIVFGKIVVNDVAPVIRKERTMLPIRFIVEKLGGKVAWNAAERKVTITKGKKLIEIVIDSSTAYVNGKAVQLDAPAFIENDRTYLPLRFVAENLDATVLWDAKARQVIIVPKAEATVIEVEEVDGKTVEI